MIPLLRKATAQCWGEFNMDLTSCQDKSLTLSNPIFQCRRQPHAGQAQKVRMFRDHQSASFRQGDTEANAMFKRTYRKPFVVPDKV